LQLLSGLVDLSILRNCPVAMHLAESRHELDLLQSASGPFVDLLQELNAWYPQTHVRGSAIGDYLCQLARSPRSLVVHGNYLTADEIRLIARYRDRMSIAYCPRTYRFFGPHPVAHPLPDLIDHNVRVVVGTDSRASNPDLDLWCELKAIAGEYPAIDPDRILEMGTLHGAEALGYQSLLGSLSPGKLAAINVVRSDDFISAGGPARGLFHSSSNCLPLEIYPD
jgi:cytosine/adenosine deaminase-related metal-dependent hydrolase